MAERNLRKTRVGLVVSDKMDKTVVVAIVDNGDQTAVQGQEMACHRNPRKGKVIRKHQ